MKVIKEKHSLAMRWFHWVNFPILAIMIWSGILIYWANGVYSLDIFGYTILKFFPAGFYKSLNIPFRLAEGMAWHFTFMWLYTINGVLYVLYTWLSGSWRELVPRKNSFREAWYVLLHDLHIKKGLPPQNKYNAAQRIAYSFIIVMGFGSFVTGLAIYKPIQFYWITWLCGGYGLARVEHFALTVGFVLFFTIHIVQVIMAGWNNFNSAITGLEVVEAKNASANKVSDDE